MSFDIPGAYVSGQIGSAELPVFSQLVETHPESIYKIDIKSIDSVIIDLSTEFPNYRIKPVQPPVRKALSEVNDTFV